MVHYPPVPRTNLRRLYPNVAREIDLYQNIRLVQDSGRRDLYLLGEFHYDVRLPDSPPLCELDGRRFILRVAFRRPVFHPPDDRSHLGIRESALVLEMTVSREPGWHFPGENRVLDRL